MQNYIHVSFNKSSDFLKQTNKKRIQRQGIQIADK